jgi:predicted acetyltransferase
MNEPNDARGLRPDEPGYAPEPPLSIEVHEARTANERALIRNLYPLYLHDLTEFTEFYDVDERGIFFPDYLPDWLDRVGPTTHPLIVRAGGKPAGFALVAQAPFPHMTRGRDYRMCEFFVLKRYRRRGVGRRAAQAIFARFPGLWEVSELPLNTGAIAFWRRTIGEYTGGAFAEGVEHGDVVQVFDSRMRGPA